MDNPTGTAQGDADKLRFALHDTNTSGLPDHLFVSREYIKAELFSSTGLEPHGTVTGPIAVRSLEVRSNLPKGPGVPNATDAPSTAPVAAETSRDLQDAHHAASGGGRKHESAVYAHIGRASHALEDFWSHSNFVEKAIGQVRFMGSELDTSTFGPDDKLHAISDKIRAAAAEMEDEMPLVDRMASRRDTDPDPSEVQLGDEPPVQHEDDASDLIRARSGRPAR